ncbi:hypothetical protein KIL84_010512 [Mauremys mutica]|uniref:Uncharacterized protein n=1 Tax=Mauremys mutica TaxID=74926 RepID=A0A9D3XD26_9SAUR|nr:hypothetical protein KIL84_010512 [Mauremys mutica]
MSGNLTEYGKKVAKLIAGASLWWMSSAGYGVMNLRRLKKLQALVHLYRQDPDLLRGKQLSLLRDNVKIIGDPISLLQCNTSVEKTAKKEEESPETAESEESDLEIEDDGVIEPDLNDSQEMGDEYLEKTNEMIDQANEKR